MTDKATLAEALLEGVWKNRAEFRKKQGVSYMTIHGTTAGGTPIRLSMISELFDHAYSLKSGLIHALSTEHDRNQPRGSKG